MLLEETGYRGIFKPVTGPGEMTVSQSIGPVSQPTFQDLLAGQTVAIDKKVKVGVLRPVQQPGSYWDRSSELPLVGLEPTEVTAYD